MALILGPNSQKSRSNGAKICGRRLRSFSICRVLCFCRYRYRDNYLPRQGGYVFTCFCLFGCYQDYAKTTQPIFRATEEGLELGLVGLGLRLTFHVTLRRTVLRLDDG